MLTAVQIRIHHAAMQLFAANGGNQVTVSELAAAAGIARGTVYNNLDAPEQLFESVAAQLADEMHARIVTSFATVEDPVLRLANGCRMFIRRAHEEPHWGRFVNRFSLNNTSLQNLLQSQLLQDVMAGVQAGRYSFRPDQLPGVIAMIAGTVLTSMFLVLEGHRSWRQAGADATELVLRAMGLPADQALALATSELPPLPEAR